LAERTRQCWAASSRTTHLCDERRSRRGQPSLSIVRRQRHASLQSARCRRPAQRHFPQEPAKEGLSMHHWSQLSRWLVRSPEQATPPPLPDDARSHQAVSTSSLAADTRSSRASRGRRGSWRSRGDREVEGTALIGPMRGALWRAVRNVKLTPRILLYRHTIVALHRTPARRCTPSQPPSCLQCPILIREICVAPRRNNWSGIGCITLRRQRCSVDMCRTLVGRGGSRLGPVSSTRRQRRSGSQHCHDC
jgi:hypothetical protein